MTSVFTSRRLKIRFELSSGSFTGREDDNVIELDGLRISARITNTPAVVCSQAQLSVFGLSAETMDALTILCGATPNAWAPNRMYLYAVEGDSQDVVFQGNVFQAVADYNAAPNVALHVFAMTQFGLQAVNPGPLTFEGNNKVGTVVQAILDKVNATIPNAQDHYGVIVAESELPMLTDVSLQNDAWGMIWQVCRQIGAVCWLEGDTVVISKIGGKGLSDETIEVDTKNGMIGYPVLTATGCIVRALFSNRYRIHGQVLLTSNRVRFRGADMMKNDRGEVHYRSQAMFWISALVSHLDSEIPNGLWQSEMQLNYTIEQGKK